MWETAILVMMLNAIDPAPQGISCNFPATHDAERGITVRMSDRPSLKDQPGLYRVELEVNGKTKVLATAQPITTTGERDAVILARPNGKSVLTVGFREDGKAALSLRKTPDAEPETRLGTCRGFEGPLNRWLAS